MSGLDVDIGALLGETVAGKYRIDSLLGRGGMGAVLQATNTAIGKRVALKFLYRETARDLDSVTRFQREAEAASAVESAHIVQIFDSGTTEDDLPFLVMELLKGEDLRSRLRREGRLQLPEVVHVAGQVTRGLRSAHEAGIVHRDLKPDNVFLCERDDDPMFVKIVDFGISKISRRPATADTLTRKGVVLGTAFYVSPEQAQALSDVDGRTDLFSLGAIMYEALAGRPPHVGSAYEAVLIDICTRDADDIRKHAPEVPEAIAQLLAKALRRNRDERFQTAHELYEALALAAPGMLRVSGPSSSSEKRSGAAVAVGTTSSRAAERRLGAEAEEPAAESPFGTAQGTAVRPSTPSSSSLQLRRTLVVAVVAALGAFALTVLLLARNRPATGSASETDRSLTSPQIQPPASSAVTVTAAASARESQQPGPESAPSDAGSAEAGDRRADRELGPASGGRRRAAKVRQRGSRRPATKKIGSTDKPSGKSTRSDGVAKGLRLVTEP